jgi:hypothetical protein
MDRHVTLILFIMSVSIATCQNDGPISQLASGSTGVDININSESTSNWINFKILSVNNLGSISILNPVGSSVFIMFIKKVNPSDCRWLQFANIGRFQESSEIPLGRALCRQCVRWKVYSAERFDLDIWLNFDFDFHSRQTIYLRLLDDEWIVLLFVYAESE